MSEANSAKGSFVACVGGVGVVDCSKIPKASSANAGGRDPSSAPFVSRATGVDSNAPKASSTDVGADGVTTPGAWNMSISRGLSSIGAPNRSSIDGSGAATGRACSSPVGASEKSASWGDGDGAASLLLYQCIQTNFAICFMKFLNFSQFVRSLLCCCS